MADVKWIRLAVDIVDNRKIKKIRRCEGGNDMFTVWIYLLALAGQCNDGGRIWIAPEVPYTVEDLAMDYGFAYADVDSALKMFAQLSMVHTDENGFITITDWESHQNIEGMERIREQNRVRKQRQRDREDVTLMSHVTSRDSHAVTSRDSHATDKNRIDKNREDKNIKEDGEEKDLTPASPPAPTRHQYGSYNNVLLTDEELEKLKNEFPDWEQRIERLSGYIASKGVKYKNHLATIRNWARKDKDDESKTVRSDTGFVSPFRNIGETF